MNIPNHLAELIKKLKDKTESKKLSWSQTSRETEFQCKFSGGSVTTDTWSFNGNVVADFAVYNKEGGQVERVTYSEGSQEFSIIYDLYIKIQSSITKSEETYDNLFNELDNL